MESINRRPYSISICRGASSSAPASAPSASISPSAAIPEASTVFEIQSLSGSSFRSSLRKPANTPPMKATGSWKIRSNQGVNLILAHQTPLFFLATNVKGNKMSNTLRASLRMGSSNGLRQAWIRLTATADFRLLLLLSEEEEDGMRGLEMNFFSHCQERFRTSYRNSKGNR